MSAKAAALLALVVVLSLFVSNRVRAISREEDLIRNIGELFRAPSSYPPNNALRPNLNGVSDDNGARTLQPLADHGPGVEDPPEQVPIRFYPFMAAIAEDGRPPQQGYVCAGALIAPQWVLTAAHCTFSWTRRWPFDFEPYVLLNTQRLATPGRKFAVTRIVPHPDYDARTLKNDLALLKIETKGERLGPPIRLDGASIQSQVGEIAHVLGWGVTNQTLFERRKGEGLQLLQVAIRDDACFRGANYPELKGTGVFCGSSLYRYHDVCYRFGGAPVTLRDAQGRRYLAGLVSWPATCPPVKDKMNVFLDVQHYLPWIKGVIQKNGGPG